MDRARRNVLLLALCQAAFISTAALMSTIGTLAGHASGSGSARQSRSASLLLVGVGWNLMSSEAPP